MILLATQAMPQMREHACPELGRLVTPRHDNSIAEHEPALVWAADNDCFQGLNAPAWLAMLERVERHRHRGRLAFCTAPDRVGDAAETRAMFERWAPELERRRLPVALVLQDGLELPAERAWIPWERLAAVFVGGSDAFKLSATARELVREAKRRGLWAHMGRVNSYGRARKAAHSFGCDSIDGTGWVKYRHANLDRGLAFCAALAAQTTLELEA